MNMLCTIALVLLMDVSASVNHENYQLQHEGLIQAFQSEQLQQTIISQPHGVAVSVIHWATYADVIVDWHHLRTRSQIHAFVRDLQAVDRHAHDLGMNTGIGTAIQAGMAQLARTPCEADQQILDVSGDGDNNVGPPPGPIRDIAQDAAITINGLPIVTEHAPDVVTYYREHVVTSDGFVLQANGFSDFGRAIRRKIQLEIAGVD
jgi:Ca-activated chloride channel family protein